MYNVSEVSEIRRRGQRLLRHNYGPEELATTMEASAAEDDTKVSTTTPEASIEEAEYAMRLSERLRRRRRRCVYGLRVLTTTTEASAE